MNEKETNLAHGFPVFKEAIENESCHDCKLDPCQHMFSFSFICK